MLSAFAQIGRRQRIRANLKLKRRFTQALLQAGNGKRPAFLARSLTQAEHRILILAGIDLLHLVQGAAAERIVRTLTKFHAREMLHHWICDPNPQLRRKAAEGLGYIADSYGCLSLGRALDDSDLPVRFAAAASLIRLGVAPPADALMASLGTDHGQSKQLWKTLDLLRAHHPDAAQRWPAPAGTDDEPMLLPIAAVVP
jgi:hypothetical protein